MNASGLSSPVVARSNLQPLFADVDWQPVINAIAAADKILLTTHCNPDGDGIGSQQAMYDALIAMGKNVVMHNFDGVPRIYSFLKHAEQVTMGAWQSGSQDADLIIALDCGAKGRLGMADAFYDGTQLVNIDHHVSNKYFADINIVDARYCATGAMVFDLLIAMDIALTRCSASAIYAAVLTDTASFRLSNATSAVYRMAADLIDAGAEPWPITIHIYESQPLAGLKILKATLDTLQLRDENRSAWIHVTSDMYQSTGADVEDSEGLIDYARSIDGVEVAVFIRCDENHDNCWKVSFRGKTTADVGALAATLGGGGHKHAAGCLMRGGFDDVRTTVEKAVSQILG
ncbi:DHH family/DHHA1 domain protein [Mariprofundus sp. EBB-1]|uniref:DHH family phosphoesterase n=1 Tax=Mariprofundus sp. EBB-1 TaxID=2650971 RepID=UPI000EF19992|nr:DHH family phosphoesterase [Mariprofundus sp. EBB-1]RLL55540.1 DHH family/DHHA1 domain protein [Mariprofundus sp. EBB-1]